jgi:hypothetical protein
MTPAQKQNARARQAAFKARRAELGLVQCNIWLSVEQAASLQDFLVAMQANPNLHVARLVDVTTGKLTGARGVKAKAPGARDEALSKCSCGPVAITKALGNTTGNTDSMTDDAS